MARINHKQIRKVAELIKKMPEGGPGLNFYSFGSGDKEIVASDMYPSLNHPETINFFFFACLHQFGFWYGDDRGYLEPMFGTINGKRYKGSDLLWRVLIKSLKRDERSLSPERLAIITPDELMTKVFSDDNGPIPFPDLEKRLKITRSYGRWFNDHSTCPSEIVAKANRSQSSLAKFLNQVGQIEPFGRDEHQKKILLLAMTMANRPERFLKVNDPLSWRPIVDYHLIRISLRLGLIEPLHEHHALKNRLWVNSEMEDKIRLSAYCAVTALISLTDRTMSFIDEKMWSARKYCPEMSEPNCSKCPFSQVCLKRTELFQPVFRTTAY